MILFDQEASQGATPVHLRVRATIVTDSLPRVHPAIASLLSELVIDNLWNFSIACRVDAEIIRCLVDPVIAEIEMRGWSWVALRAGMTLDQFAVSAREYNWLKLFRSPGSLEHAHRAGRSPFIPVHELSSWKSIADALSVGLDELRFRILRDSRAYERTLTSGLADSLRHHQKTRSVGSKRIYQTEEQ